MCYRKKGICSRRILKRCAFLLGFVLLTAGVSGAWNVQASPRVLKVGYIDYDGFIQEEYGEFSGYGVEYLGKISEYTGWDYAYVFDTWENCLDKLSRGEIDLLCTAQKTPERAEKFAYADMPLGYETTMIYARNDSDIYYEDIEAMQLKKVGLLAGSFQTEEFGRFAEEKNLSYEPVYFQTEESMLLALQNGEVDLAAAGSLARHMGVRVVGKYGAEAFYCITQKGGEDLVGEIDEALRSIKMEDPGFETRLQQKYYGDSQMSESPLFTREEHDYIRQAEPVKVKMIEDYAPLSYEKDGECSGIFVEYLNRIGQKSGLKFEYEIDIQPESILKPEAASPEKGCLVVRSKRSLEYEGQDEGQIYGSFLDFLSMSCVKRQKDVVTGKNHSFALTKEMRYLEKLLYQDDIGSSIQYYDTPQECLSAVVKGKADIAIQYSYVVSYLMQKPRYGEALVEIPAGTLENGICLSAVEEDQILLDIIKKASNHIGIREEEDIISSELLRNPFQEDMGDFLYKYRYPIASLGFALLLIGAAYILVVHYVAKLRLKKREYEILQKQVQQDELTGVYNRKAFFEKAEEMVANSGQDTYIVMMDINNFKVVNDLYGMESGDRLLCQMAQELQKLGTGRELLVARFSGDHFYMCMGKKDFQEIHFPQHFKTFLEDMDIKAAYGVFVTEGKERLPVNIMCDRASLALHTKEQRQLDYIFYYSGEERDRILQEQEIENEMEQALKEKQFCIYIQPQYDVFQERIVGGEALVRWVHPQKGLIPPDKFISVFERNGFILQLDYYVWEETCKLLSKLKEDGITGIPISINVSRAHFYGTELKGKLAGLIEKYHLDPGDLELEITETMYAKNPDILYQKIHELREAGFKIAMDDFGSGYSSLNMLKEMPLDILKMDLKFLDGGDDDRKSQYILNALINLAKNLQLTVIVEGVETEIQVTFLRSIRNHYAQGYYYSRPVESSSYEAMLKKEKGVV